MRRMTITVWRAMPPRFFPLLLKGHGVLKEAEAAPAGCTSRGPLRSSWSCAGGRSVGAEGRGVPPTPYDAVCLLYATSGVLSESVVTSVPSC